MSVNVSYGPPDLQLVAQPTSVSCWAAALTMVVSYRDKASYDPATIASRAGMDLNTGYGWSQIESAVTAWNLVEEGPTSSDPYDWANKLTQWGPIWVVEIGNPFHAVVLAGINGDGTPDGTMVTVYNPSPVGVGAVQTKSFTAFETEFELGAPANAMLVHAIAP
jgi:ABC-type bacteriocin/lantibiotic exporter with double-glycine peptidase domain